MKFLGTWPLGQHFGFEHRICATNRALWLQSCSLQLSCWDERGELVSTCTDFTFSWNCSKARLYYQLSALNVFRRHFYATMQPRKTLRKGLYLDLMILQCFCGSRLPISIQKLEWQDISRSAASLPSISTIKINNQFKTLFGLEN